jgi:hypothetical protein
MFRPLCPVRQTDGGRSAKGRSRLLMLSQNLCFLAIGGAK